MRRLFRWAFRLLILLMALAVAALLLLDTIAREAAERWLHNRTGLDARIGRMRVGLFEPYVTIENLVLYNTTEFGGSPVLKVPEFHADYDRAALRSYKIHCKLVRLNIAQANVVEGKTGRINLNVLLDTLQKPGNPLLTTNPAPTGYQFLSIDTLNLTLGKATFMSMKDPARVDVLNMDVTNQILPNIKSLDDLNGTMLVIRMKNNISIIGKPNNDASERWQQWFNKLRPPAKK